MANICDNHLYAFSENKKNIKAISKFFNDNWSYSNVEEHSDEDIDVYFDSKWDFPLDEMNKLLDKLPDKDNIDIRVLSTEFGNDYVAYWVFRGDGWQCLTST